MSDSSALSKSCPQCGAALPAEATEGLCPRCLMAEAMQPTAPKTSSGSWQPPSPEELQALIPGYTIEKLLGKGGMGAVYKGVQVNLDRPVAIKIISNVLDEADASYGERFKNEARAMAKLNHPGIVAVHDYGETANGILYIVMEYIEGTDVARMIAQQKRLHTEHAMAITAHVCDALAYAHERGIIHRDIKPANIMVSNEGVVKVADFGLAKMTKSGESGLTQSGMAMGTLHYMAPEALMLGSEVDHRADIYAVGVMLYQMLTGKVPHGMFELPSMQVPGLDPRYDAIIAQAMREDRDIRYQSVRGLRGDLDSILTQPVVQVDPQATRAAAAVRAQAERPSTQPHRTAGQPYRPPQSQVVMRSQPKKRSPWVWVTFGIVFLVVIAYFFRPQNSAFSNSQQTDQLNRSLPASLPIADPSPAKKTTETSSATNPGPVPPKLAAISEKNAMTESIQWVDGLAELWKGGMSPDVFERGNGNMARVVLKTSSICARPASHPMRDQVVRATVRADAWGVGVRHPNVMLPNAQGASYEVIIKRDRNNLRLRIVNPSTRNFPTILNFPPLPAEYDWSVAHTIEVRAVKDLITVFLDGKNLGSTRDDSIAQGYPIVWLNPVGEVQAFEFADLSGTPATSQESTRQANVPELVVLQEQYEKLQAERVTAVFAADVAKLNSGYLGGIDREIVKERAAGHLDGVLALEEEKKRITAKQSVPERDGTGTLAAVKNLRIIYREAYAKLEAARLTNSKALTDPLVPRLKALEADLAKQNRIANAMAVRKYWEKLPAQESTAADSIKTLFINSLGMKFVSLPGTKVKICIHETRKVDFANFAFAVAATNASWKNVRIQDGLTVSASDDHPVVNVSWEEATAFCAWLSTKEGKTYRLPTDREWSIAVGIGTRETSMGTPESRNAKLKDIYPWGTQWPPPASAGNYADATLAGRSPTQKTIPGFTDGHATTAPVMSFPPNALGIHDLGGNVWEFCSDAFSTSSKVHVLRGGSWGDAEQHWLLSSSRDPFEQSGRYNIVGFRCVLESTAP
jgi:serine/threonine protein kinase/formylglycine-generating enzyme required for sulfatase activity